MLNNAFLLTLPAHVQDRLGRSLEPIRVSSGTDLYLPLDEVDWVYFPIAGLISLISVMRNGDEAETGIVGREGALGMVEAAGSGRMLYRAVVQIDLNAVRMPTSEYLSLLRGSVVLQRAVARHTELNLAEIRQTAACRSHHKVQPRLAWWLLECQDRTGYESLYLTQEFLAAMLGAQRTTLNAAISVLRKAGLIRVGRGAIYILDRPGLERASCECYSTITRYRQDIEHTAPHRSAA
ncbi:Crp/Fnr family transcriptional regulator [Brevundimonas sp. SL161]|uniref:Crp/Fnr family transcriptional regulator n=1 Tax=Brevundimonas sp. SL161 TaxID=2804613 RepID=UPI003CED1273